jgi:simple sugar transport system ATP-binding protein
MIDQAPTHRAAPHLVVDGVCKTFGAFRALDQVMLHVDKASIHAVLGENGAGKTSLMNVLYGIYRPDQGEIRIDGKPIELRSPRDAIRLRIGMIHQHFHLADALTVTENIVLGLGRAASILRLSMHGVRIREMSEALGLEIDPDSEVWRLPMGMRQRVEILKALYRGADILVLDEPTSVLAPSEIATFLEGLRRLRAVGTTILFVTHKLEEVMGVTDAVTVMRAGRAVAELRTRDTDAKELSRLMIGRNIAIQNNRREIASGDVALILTDVTARSDRDLAALDRISLTVRGGEIHAIVGIDGNGQRELAEVITGLRAVASGSIEARGRDIGSLDVKRRMTEIGIRFVPEDRHAAGLVLDHSVASNLVLRSFDRPPVSRHGLIDGNFVAKNGRRLVSEYDVRVHSAGQSARNLSGGNQQKVILAREIEARPHILVVAQATKGLDVGAIEFVQSKLLEQRANGVAILYISTELEQVMEVADRISVICGGRIVGELDPKDVTAEAIGLLMAGVPAEVAQ